MDPESVLFNPKYKVFDVTIIAKIRRTLQHAVNEQERKGGGGDGGGNIT
jgi:hypothetical protein